jgi:hypothetical protein
MMKILIILFALQAGVFSLFAGTPQILSKSDSVLISTIGSQFEQAFSPFARKFAQESYPSKIRTEGLIDAQYRIYINKAHMLTEGFLSPDIYTGISEISKEFVYSVFESAYRNNFPGLNYSFFDKVRKGYLSLGK